jgi:dTDP-4-amino-4,6-dideoxygalactose transaminase
MATTSPNANEQRSDRQSPDAVPAFSVRFSAGEIAEFMRRAEAILASGQLVPGVNNEELERQFAWHLGAPHAVAVSSGTAALEIGLRCLGLAGRPVLVPANTNYATAEAVVRAGARPVLYDSGLYPDIQSIDNACPADAAAVIVVHIGGYLTPSMPEITRFCAQRGLHLVEDASHAHGATLRGRSAGTFGHVAAFSTFATKVLTTSEGGLLVTSDPTVANDAVRYRDQGKADDGLRSVLFGSAWRMSELHAALGVAQLGSLGTTLRRHNEIIGRYVAGIDHPGLRVPYEREVRYSGHKMIVLAEDPAARDRLRVHLLVRGIGCAKGVYEVPLHRQPALRLDTGHRFPAADHFAAAHLCLPLSRWLTDDQVDTVIDAVNGWPHDG